MVTAKDLKEIEHIAMVNVRSHYDDRVKIHKILKSRFMSNKVKDYVNLALGIEDHRGNYSASEYKLGAQILMENTPSSVFSLAQKLFSCKLVAHIPKTIYNANTQYIKIGVGSEMAAMLRPESFWVGNVRTIWTHLLIKHDWDYDNVKEELQLYKNNDISSEMAYQIWRDIYLSMEPNLSKLVEIGNKSASQNGVKPGRLKYLWADAIANELYEYKDI